MRKSPEAATVMRVPGDGAAAAVAGTPMSATATASSPERIPCPTRRRLRASVVAPAAGGEIAHAVEERRARAGGHARERSVRHVRVRPRRRDLLEGLDPLAELAQLLL